MSDSALNTRVHLARSAVGDNGEDQRLIRTIPRKGFRFVAPVREDQAAANAVPQRAEPAAETHIADAAARIALPCLAICWMPWGHQGNRRPPADREPNRLTGHRRSRTMPRGG